jgi:hypothetical protein
MAILNRTESGNMPHFFAAPETLSLDARRLGESSPTGGLGQHALNALDDAFRCVDGLNALGAPHDAPSLTVVRKSLEKKLSERLIDAAEASTDATVANHFLLRSEAITTQKYDAAREFGAATQLTTELILGPVPSWRWADQRLTFSATLAVRPEISYPLQVETIDAIVKSIAHEFLGSVGAYHLESNSKLQTYSIVNLIGLAGDAAMYPCHFANFLPEDEGHPGSTKKTILYQNFYLERFERVSLPLLRNMATAGIAELPLHAKPVLLSWFRAHDIAHSFFDGLCRRSGLQASVLHSTRELLADLVGFLVAGKSNDHAPAILIAEMLRYAGRSPTLFADSASARVQLSWLQDQTTISEVIRDPEKFHEIATELTWQVVKRLASGDAAHFAHWLNRLVNLPSNNYVPGGTYTVSDLYPLLKPLRSTNSTRAMLAPRPSAIHCWHW